MITITSVYQGDLRCTATHPQSGVSIMTDAPTDNQGKGEAFSPTDLLAAALGTCMMTIMGIVAARHGVDLKGMTAVTVKEMSRAAPRKIATLRTRLTIPLPPDHQHRAILEQGARSCPVHHSLDPTIDSSIEFIWAG